MTNDFKPSCPHCYNDDFQLLGIPFEKPIIAGWQLLPSSTHACERCGRLALGLMWVKEDNPARYRHSVCIMDFLHCAQCGDVFETAQAIELRLLEPVEV